MPVPWMTMGRMPPTLESNFFPPGSGRLGGRSAIARHLVPGFVRYYVTYTHKCAYVYTLHCVYIYTFCIHVYLVCIRIFINAPAYAVHRFHIHCRCTYIYILYHIYNIEWNVSWSIYKQYHAVHSSKMHQNVLGVDGLKPGQDELPPWSGATFQPTTYE